MPHFLDNWIFFFFFLVAPGSLFYPHCLTFSIRLSIPAQLHSLVFGCGNKQYWSQTEHTPLNSLQFEPPSSHPSDIPEPKILWTSASRLIDLLSVVSYNNDFFQAPIE